ncbi:MAG: hypothetical protein GWO10_21835, partial [candidate division Zixibacteria bacterium]|nr:hypothetical protein [Phycisphaerae bacterium]NIR66335.1 hypothetical protein [candidate division Zixibacteria bacterium]
MHFTETISTHTIIFQAPGGSRFPYYGSGDNTYTRYPGVTAEMVRTDGASPSDTRYVITTFNQYEFTFDADGNFIKQEDPSGNTLTLTYVSDKLDKVSQGSRYLEFTYNGADRVETVEDNFGRTITMTYDVNDNLTSIANPLNQTTTFNYKTSTNLLDEIVDASGRTVKEIFYDSEDRAYAVRDGEGNLLAYINYNVGGSSFGGGSGFAADDDLSATRLITVSGVVMTYTYDSRGTIVDVTQACTEDVAGCQANSGSAYDYNFKHNEVVDENGNPTVMNWSTGGSNLEGTTDALGNSTSLTYDNLNNLTQ